MERYEPETLSQYSQRCMKGFQRVLQILISTQICPSTTWSRIADTYMHAPYSFWYAIESGEKMKERKRPMYLHPKLSPGLVPLLAFLQNRNSM